VTADRAKTAIYENITMAQSIVLKSKKTDIFWVFAIRLHGATTNKTAIFLFAAVRT
jgi:hypothetical protein